MFLQRSGKGYFFLAEKVNGKVKYIKSLCKDPMPYFASLEKGKEIIEAIKRYPDLATIGSGQAILAEYKRRTLIKEEIPDKLYKTIVIDPPWPIEKIKRKVVPINQQYDFDYATMTVKEIELLPVSKLSDPSGCHLYLWTTQKFLPVAFQILNIWGFQYIFTIVWHKNGGFQPFGLPQYNCEFILFGKKNGLDFLSTKDFFCCFNGLRREHSRKPVEFDNIIKRVSPEPRLDWFARELKSGFDSIGSERGRFDEMP